MLNALGRRGIEPRLPVDPTGYDFQLSDLQKKLANTKYFGSITIVWQNGEIVLIREERTLKPGQFDRFI